MPSAFIIFLLVGLLILLVAGLQVYKKLEEARIEKLRRIAQLTHAYRLTQRYLNGIPGQYLNVDIRKFLVQRAINFLEKLQNEEPRSSLYRSKLSLNQSVMEELKVRPKPKPSQLIQDANAAKDASALISECAHFIEIQTRRESASREIAIALIQQLNWYTSACMADFHCNQAEANSQTGDHRRAVYHLNNAIVRFARHPEIEKARIQLLECQARLQKEKELAEVQVDNEDKSKLNQELESMLDEENKDLRKKQYD